MSQADQVIQNATFPATRTDINDNLAALFSQSSGNSEPTVKVAFQPWIDTSVSPPLWKIRNSTNTAWITVGTLDATFSVGGLTAIANGGTGATTAANALAALLPSQTGNSGKALTTNGTTASWGTVASGISYQLFTSSGSYLPTTGKTTCLVIVIGGGGGGGSGSSSYSGGYGGSGGTAIRIYSAAELGTSGTITVGSGGAGGLSPGNGASGGTSSFVPGGTGLTISCAGGTGGTYATSSGSGISGSRGSATNSIFSMYNSWTAVGTGGAGGYVSSGSAGLAGFVLILEW